VFSFRIPDTVICREGVAQQWYFTSKDGTLLKKNHSNINFSNLKKAMSEDLPCQIQTYTFTQPKLPPNHNEPVDLFIEYITHS
jgi:hypothetical protein